MLRLCVLWQKNRDDSDDECDDYFLRLFFVGSIVLEFLFSLLFIAGSIVLNCPVLPFVWCRNSDGSDDDEYDDHNNRDAGLGRGGYDYELETAKRAGAAGGSQEAAAAAGGGNAKDTEDNLGERLQAETEVFHQVYAW